MTDDEYMLCLRQNILDVAVALTVNNVEECRSALRSIALGLIPESRLKDFGAILCREGMDQEQWRKSRRGWMEARSQFDMGDE